MSIYHRHRTQTQGNSVNILKTYYCLLTFKGNAGLVFFFWIWLTFHAVLLKNKNN